MVNDNIVIGKAYRVLRDAATKAWDKISFWTSSFDVEFNDGKNAETKLGAINGITDSLVSDSSNVAASAKAVSELNNNFNNDLPFKTRINNGKPEWSPRGADTWSPFNQGIITLDVEMSGNTSYMNFSSWAARGSISGTLTIEIDTFNKTATIKNKPKIGANYYSTGSGGSGSASKVDATCVATVN